jgi:hypothetical protein
MIKRVDRKRVNRIAWKIVRGLYYNEHHAYLQEPKELRIKFFQGFGIDEVPDFYKFIFNNTETVGIYKGIFCYRHNTFSFIENHQTWDFWSLMFWDSLVVVIIYKIENFQIN